MYVPPNLTPGARVPLLVAPHGGTGWGTQFEQNSGFDQLADRYGVELGTHFPARFAYLGAFDISYRDAMAASLEALAAAHGDLSGNAHRFMSALSGLTLDSPLDPFKALYWAAIFNGVVAVPIMVVMMRMAVRPDIMGTFVIRPRLRRLGWFATALMAAAVVAMLTTQLV